MNSLHNIILIVDKELDGAMRQGFGNCVKNVLPKSVIVSFSKDRINEKYRYIVSLNRSLFEDEVNTIMEKWERKYKYNFNMEISHQSIINKKILKRHVFNTPKEETNDNYEHKIKQCYNNWVKDMNDNGWQYGQIYNKKDKTSPNLVSWNSLHISYRDNILNKCKEANYLKENYNIFNNIFINEMTSAGSISACVGGIGGGNPNASVYITQPSSKKKKKKKKSKMIRRNFVGNDNE